MTRTLRTRILRSLEEQGFEFRDERLAPPDMADKQLLRTLHRDAVAQNRMRSRSGLERHEARLLQYIAGGSEVVPEAIRPLMVLVRPGTEDELLFRYARLHWSIPISAGYGRRLRFVIYDEANGKLIGLLGMCDPVFGLGPRDRWIGWNHEDRRRRLQSVMNLFVLGAVPPYSALLCGKLIALLATSWEVQIAFANAYGGRTGTISGRRLDTRLALLSTTSAFGRSSLYNRLRHRDRAAFLSVGFTSGTGDFHFSDGFYEDLRRFALQSCTPTAKKQRWGTGFRNRRELVRKTLPLLGLSGDLLHHGIQREILVAPLATNAQRFLRGDDEDLIEDCRSASEIFAWFRERWLLPRADWDTRFQEFDPEMYRLWPSR